MLWTWRLTNCLPQDIVKIYGLWLDYCEGVKTCESRAKRITKEHRTTMQDRLKREVETPVVLQEDLSGVGAVASTAEAEGMVTYIPEDHDVPTEDVTMADVAEPDEDEEGEEALPVLALTAPYGELTRNPDPQRPQARKSGRASRRRQYG